MTTKFTLDRNYTNILRGLAMAFIMLQHSIGGPFSVMPGVAIFIFLSGFGNNESFLKKSKWGGVHLLKIAIPYWIVRLALLIYYGGTSDWKTLLLDLTFIKIQSVYWFVAYLMKWYVAYWIGVNLLYKYRWYLWIVLSILSFFFLDTLAAENSFCFILGIAASENKDKLYNLPNKTIIITSAALLLISVISISLYLQPTIRNVEMLYTLTHTTARLPMSLAIVGLVWLIRPLCKSRILLFMAPITYELYLVHMKALNVLDKTSVLTYSYSMALFIAISFVGAVLLNKLNTFVLRRITKR